MNKTQLAAVSGVMAFLESEKAHRKPIAEPSRYLFAASPWTLYGRKRIMQMRSLIQGRYLRANKSLIHLKASDTGDYRSHAR